MALAEFSVGRGFLLSQVAASVRAKGSPSIGLHADHNWLPAPFPAHNMLLTACWACDSYTQENGATLIIPDTAELKRHPSHEEVEALEELNLSSVNRAQLRSGTEISGIPIM